MYDNDLTEFPEAEAEGEGDSSDGEDKHVDASGERGAAGGAVPMDAETAEPQEAAVGAADAAPGEEPDAAEGQAADEAATVARDEAAVTKGAFLGPCVLTSRFLTALVCNVAAGPKSACVLSLTVLPHGSNLAHQKLAGLQHVLKAVMRCWETAKRNSSHSFLPARPREHGQALPSEGLTHIDICPAHQGCIAGTGGMSCRQRNVIWQCAEFATEGGCLNGCRRWPVS